MTTEATRALLLLSAPLGDPAAPVLGVPERRRLESWLRRAGATLPVLGSPAALDRLCAADPPPVPASRLRGLLDRATALDAALSGWADRALQPVGLFDDRYPRRLKRRLGSDAPPVLLLRGDPATLNRGGTALFGAPPPRLAAALLAASGESGSPLLCAAGDPAADLLPTGPAGGGAPVLFTATADPVPAAAALHPVPVSGAGIATVLVPVPPLLPLAAPALDPAFLALLLADAVLLCPDADADVLPPLPLLRVLEARWLPVWLHPPADPRFATLLRLGARPLDAVAARRSDLLRHLRSADPAAADHAAAPRVPPPSRPRLVPSAGFAEAAAPFGNSGHGPVAPPPILFRPTPVPGGPGAGLPAGPRSGPRLVASNGRRAVAPDRPAPVPPPAEILLAAFLSVLPGVLRGGPLGITPLCEALGLSREQCEAWLLRAEGRRAVLFDPATRLYSLPPPV
ncbi:MAG: hypothetical protein INR65_11770 [Gluconacetobacter diazotrophicus]|nr:hypothetical protein [Gluconacetobacter diazotrophicus]